MAKNPGAKDSKGRYLDPAAAINAGLMTKKTAGVVSPGKIVAKVAAKVAEKVATKAATKKSIAAGKMPATAKTPAQKAKVVVKEAKKAAKVEAKALKAANKPTNKTGSKADRADRATFQGNSNLIKNASPARANRTRGGSLAAIKTYGGQGVATAKLTPKQARMQAELTKEMNPVRKVKPSTKNK